MELLISDGCPTCGAPITLHEDDHLLLCPYCGVKNYMVRSGWPRFVLQPPANFSHRHADRLFYLPYLRFKGTIFSCACLEVQHNLVDTTRIAISLKSLPPTLGLRPQAMKLLPTTRDMSGTFIRQQLKSESVLHQAVLLAELFSAQAGKNPVHRALVGETVSRVYLPVMQIGERLYDGLTGDLFDLDPAFLNDSTIVTRWQESWQPAFLSTLCPACGDILDADAKSLVLHCRNCQTCWQENGGQLSELDWICLEDTGKNSQYLPFWHISLNEPQAKLDTLADYLTWSNQAVVIRPQYANMPLTFILPAFKINPAQFLQLAKKTTLLQEHWQKGSRANMTNLYPVTLPETEAVQAIKAVIAYSAVAPQQIFSMLPELNFAITSIRLLYLPFDDAGHDKIQPASRLSIPSASLHYGRTL